MLEPQNTPGASGQMAIKIYCSLTAGGMVCCRLRRGWICFCIVPIDGRKLSRHDEVVQMN
jgi:hypothetical protein